MRLCLWLLLLPALASAEVYRWVDAKGQVHFGQQPQAADAQAIEVRPQVVERDAATRQREQDSERFYQARRDEQAKAAVERQQQVAQRQKECTQLRARLAQMPEGRRYYGIAANGERQYYTDQQLDTARQQLNSRLSERCY